MVDGVTLQTDSPQASQVPVSDRGKDAPPSLRGLPQSFIYEETSLRGLRLCSRRVQCGKRLCPWCSTRLATEARRSLAPQAHAADSVLVLRLALATSTSLDAAWTMATETSRAFTSSRWLARRADGWLVQREVTLTASRLWNVHTSFLVFDSDPARLRSLRDDAPARWVECATSLGYRAHPSGQSAEIWTNPRKAVAYTVKGLIHQKHDSARRPGDGLSPGDLLALFYAGDADAAERWHELETFVSSGRRRWVERGGSLRGVQP